MLPGPYILLSGLLGVVLMWPLGALFNFMDWPMFNSWGLAHGSFIIAWPFLAAFSYFALWVVMRRREQDNWKRNDA